MKNMKKLELSILEKEGSFCEDGYIEIETKDLGIIKLPISIIQHSREPRITVTGAMHSCEYCGTEALIKLRSELSSGGTNLINGSVVIIPVANVLGFPYQAFNVSPYDGSNLNRSFPGKPDGSNSERLAYMLWQIVHSGDYYIDLHGGDIKEDLIPFSIVHKSFNKKVYDSSLSIALNLNSGYVVSTVSGTDYGWSDYKSLYALASEHGIPSAIFEAGDKGLVEDEFVNLLYHGLKNVFSRLGFLRKFVPKQVEEEALVIERTSWVSRSVEGCFRSFTRVGKKVKKGEPIGEVRNYLGELVETICSPIDGMVALIQTSLGMNPKNNLFIIFDTDSAKKVNGD